MNAKQLVGQMTLEEKASLCSGLDFWHTKSVERLGLHSIMMTDGPHGIRKEDESGSGGLYDSVPATCFPAACATACSFDPGLLHDVGRAIGEECLQEGVSIILGPGANLKRSPLCGRNFEYFSEDPLVSGRMAAALIEGVQENSVGTSLKHYAANNQETRRMTINVLADERAMQELYLRNFEIAVKEGKPWTVMCSYNHIDGVYSSDNKWLLTDVLRDAWGFDGLVVTDWGAMNDRVQGVRAGLDLEMPSCRGRTDAQIVKAVQSGALTEAELDKVAIRVVELILKSRDALKPGYRYDAKAHHALARRAAAESCVLLKNEDGALPLKAGASVAVIGGFAKAPRYQGAGSSKIKPTQLDCAWDELGKLGFSLSYAEGYKGVESDQALLDEAAAVAASADVALVFAGLPDEYESEGYDRTDMEMPEGHVRLIEAVAAANPRTAVILLLGAPVVTHWADRVKSILVSYLGGQAGGGGIADVLAGLVCPGGKLPESWPKALSDTPCYHCFPGGSKTVEYRESIFMGYRYYETAGVGVAFPFGHGLSYTGFSYDGLTLHGGEAGEAGKGDEAGEAGKGDEAGKPVEWDEGDTLELSLQLKNIGPVAGSEVVQLYVSLPGSKIPRPAKQLIGFQKVRLDPGESANVKFCIKRKDLAYFNTPAAGWRVEGGVYTFSVGASVRDIRLTTEARVAGDGCEGQLGNLADTCYCSPVDNTFPADGFSLLYGRPMPGPERLPGEPFTDNDILSDIAGTPVGAALLGLVKNSLAHLDEEQAQMMLMFMTQTPLRTLGNNLPDSLPPNFINMVVSALNGDAPPELAALLTSA